MKSLFRHPVRSLVSINRQLTVFNKSMLRNKQREICKFVSLAGLLIGRNVWKSSVDNMVGIKLIMRKQLDHRLNRVLSINQFSRLSVFIKGLLRFPWSRSEIYCDFGLPVSHSVCKTGFCLYGKDNEIDWYKRHKDLFQLLVAGT